MMQSSLALPAAAVTMCRQSKGY